MEFTSVTICAICATIRLLGLWAFPSIGNLLDKSVEFSTPVTSYRSLKEALVLGMGSSNTITFNNGYYDGGVVHHPPLLLQALQGIPIAYHDYLFILFDCLILLQFVKLTEQVKRQNKMFINIPTWLPALVYAINPLSLMSCLSKSSVIFTNWCIINAVVQAINGNIPITAMFISLSGYLSLYPILLIFPLINLINLNSSNPQKVNNTIRLILYTIYYCGFLIFISYKINGNNWNFLRANYMVLLNFEIVTPNLGIWWYFFIEMFTEFIPFFKGTFGLFLLSFVIPLAIRFCAQPFCASITILGWLILTKPYPVLGDYGFWFSFLAYFVPIAGYMRYKVFSMLLFIHGIMLSPIFYHLWIGSGSGNSNFFYAVSLVNALAIGTILSDLIWAMLRHEYDGETPNYEIKLAQV
ncbi:similar to Saccharomyces cerevisiae YLR459W GAB1 GPI transamidase subunit, involved in attachment of glycosylphosphatidylinositol (GPI) anchors to proteins [Maudiozyma saulgeensis]|uniref:Similar to Saccharomyces cerevisiae YLR459W GAB1 GPI transamidase subunit, involved in attachment of glycosylphosphatidylinositol (GPI) anchors to proteins n=1 Tax=Maudiozyma saulgeensis TaxID=1789683 RepID=A0A1X7R2D8_9SACH|nr:similar to Saccharomyces cerevisiae YLR459W GAB1 GPI transamidase subunit, involved in attachment of glycosylphosphatidylinositol (GPI) anchors to proteins [Kazachstania saulgeensis]